MRLSVTSLFVILLAAPLAATPTITWFDPQEGFSFASTTVTIEGSGFGDGAVTVLFDDVPATLLHVTPTTLQVRAHSPTAGQMDEQLADLTVRVAGHGEAKLADAFFFHPFAEPGPRDYTPILVPLTSAPIAGAHGSIWEAELRVFNSWSFPLRMPGPEQVISTPPLDPAVIVEPRTTERVSLPRRENGVDGHFLYVPTVLWASPKFSLRVRDTSKNAGSAGVEVPIVSRDQAAPDIHIIDVPIDEKSRATLRIYGFTPAPMRVGVTILPENGDTPHAQFDVELHGIVTTDFVPLPPHPAYIAFDPFPPAVRAAGGRVRIELTNYGANVSPPLPSIWGFVSLTNNETNQVTIITPK